MPRVIVTAVLAAFLGGCASARYQWSSQHAEVAKNVRLPRIEIEQIMRTVTQRSPGPIFLVQQAHRPGGETIIAYTEFQHDPPRFWAYELQKRSDGQWHITFDGEGSIIIRDDE